MESAITTAHTFKKTTYWTYATIHRILYNQMYIGNMEQGWAPRQTIHGRAKRPVRPWVDALLCRGGLTQLDRATVAETVRQILRRVVWRLHIPFRMSRDSSGRRGLSEGR